MTQRFQTERIVRVAARSFFIAIDLAYEDWDADHGVIRSFKVRVCPPNGPTVGADVIEVHRLGSDHEEET